jgi:uncharacterized cysteine cluster protein YcgN (CxxCxxCC family)
MWDTTRCSKQFQQDVEEFMRMVVKCVDVCDMRKCSCSDYANRYYRPIKMVKGHLYMHGFNLTYTLMNFSL